MKLKTDSEASALKDVIKVDKANIKAALKTVKADAKELRAQLVAKK